MGKNSKTKICVSCTLEALMWGTLDFVVFKVIWGNSVYFIKTACDVEMVIAALQAPD